MKKKKVIKKKIMRKSENAKSKLPTLDKSLPSLKLKRENDIAMDFAVKVYKKFNKMIKSVVLFGSTVKDNRAPGSDIDIIVLLDDLSVKWDQELIAWYREELEKILQGNPYNKSLHINTIKLSTWWEDMMRGDPVILNILRNGEAIIDLAGFFEPLQRLLLDGKIKATPEAIYSCLQRAPMHIARSRASELSAIEGLYWAMVDSAHAALISINISPPSPEHIPFHLKNNLVDAGVLKAKYVDWYRDLLILHKKISHGEIRDLKGVEIDAYQQRAEEFLEVMARIVKDAVK
jgi:predicted nucleotidyltransferase